jgi:hypothetical protein
MTAQVPPDGIVQLQLSVPFDLTLLGNALVLRDNVSDFVSGVRR